MYQVSLTSWHIRWSVACDFHCTVCKKKWTAWVEIGVLCTSSGLCAKSSAVSLLVCLRESPMVTGSWCDIGTWTMGHIKLGVNGCLRYLMRSFYVTVEVPKAHSASGFHRISDTPPPHEWNVSSRFSFGFHLLRPIPYCRTPTHPDTRAPHAVRQSHSNAKLLFPSAARLNVFFFLSFG